MSCISFAQPLELIRDIGIAFISNCQSIIVIPILTDQIDFVIGTLKLHGSLCKIVFGLRIDLTVALQCAQALGVVLDRLQRRDRHRHALLRHVTFHDNINRVPGLVKADHSIRSGAAHRDRIGLGIILRVVDLYLGFVHILRQLGSVRIENVFPVQAACCLDRIASLVERGVLIDFAAIYGLPDPTSL